MTVKKITILYICILCIALSGCVGATDSSEAINENATVPSAEAPTECTSTGQPMPSVAAKPIPSDASELEMPEVSEFPNKQNYLHSLDYLSEIEDELNNVATTLEMNEAAGKSYDRWDYELNRIYGLLQDALPADDMEELRQEQRDWIKVRDKEGDEAADVYKGGSFEGVAYAIALTSATKDRTYALIDKYFAYLALEAYKAVLLSRNGFFNADNGVYTYLNQFDYLVDANDGTLMRSEKFTIIDLDSDHVPEVVIELSGGFIEVLVLHCEEGGVYGYGFVYRALNQLKEDGSFAFSSGANNSGFGKLSFSNHTYEIDVLAHSESDPGNNAILYYVGNDKVAEENFLSFCDEQNEKKDVAWFVFIEDMEFFSR